MKLSNETIMKLQNFATIQPNLVYCGDGKLKTLAEASNILAVTTITEDIKTKFGIYDLNEFLSALSLINDPSIEFNSTHALITGGNQTVNYIFANPNILTAPTKDITMPSADVTVQITGSDIEKLRKAASVLGYNTISMCYEPGNGGIKLSVEDSINGKKGNSFTIEKEGEYGSKKFNFKFLISNIKLIEGDYTIELSSKRISQWTGKAATYWIAIEQTSTYGE